jgi:amidohydrolase
MLRNLLISALALTLFGCGGSDKNANESGDKQARNGGADAARSGNAGPANFKPAAAATSIPRRTPDPSLVTLYKGLHAAPELSFKEAATSALLAAELQKLGFTVTTGLGNAWVIDKATRAAGAVPAGVGGYGIVGVFENGKGPTVLIRTDTDALPVPEQTGFEFASKVTSQTWTGVDSPVMHACGHDIHMTAWVGAARNLIAQKNKWKGTLVMIAQPAEEIGLGAQAMLADGLFTRFPKPDYNLALHVSAGEPAGTIAYSKGYALANVDSVDIKVKGVGGHGAYPQATRDPVLIAAHIVVALQSLVSRNTDPQDAAVVTVGAIKAGAKHNIISDQAELLITVRSYDEKTRQMLLSGIARIANAQAAAFDAPAPEIKIETDYTPATYNDPALTDKITKAIGREIGAEFVREVKPVMGGEDFSQYGRTADQIPGVIFWVGAVEPARYDASQADGMPLPSLHSPSFKPDYEPAIATGVDAMTTAAIAAFKN